MIVYRISQSIYSGDLSGRGAFLHGGRWNSPGKYALYSSTHRSLALLELLVHAPMEVIIQNEYQVCTIEIPDNMGFAKINNLNDSRLVGDELLDKREVLYFDVPSVIFEQERNIIVNPLHPEAERIKIVNSERLVIDGRLL